MRERVEGWSDVAAVGVQCENCGRSKRLGPARLSDYARRGIGSVEQLGRRLSCSECRERGKGDKNISVIPYARADLLPQGSM